MCARIVASRFARSSASGPFPIGPPRVVQPSRPLLMNQALARLVATGRRHHQPGYHLRAGACRPRVVIRKGDDMDLAVISEIPVPRPWTAKSERDAYHDVVE